MNLIEYLLSILLAVTAAVVCTLLIWSNQTNRGLEEKLNVQLMTIEEGRLSQQVGMAILQDLAVASVQNDKIKKLLADNGFSVTQQPNNAAPGTSAAAGTPPTAPPANTPSTTTPR